MREVGAVLGLVLAGLLAVVAVVSRPAAFLAVLWLAYRAVLALEGM